MDPIENETTENGDEINDEDETLGCECARCGVTPANYDGYCQHCYNY